MAERVYLDFDLLVQPGRDGGYQARVLKAPAGETHPVPVVLPFSDLDLENFFLRIGRPRRIPTRGGAQTVEAQAVRDFGARLFNAVFHDEVRVALGASMDQAEGRGVGLRVRLRLAECPELADLPWEYLYDPDAHRFLALSEWTPLVRYLDQHSRVRPLAVEPPVRVLVMVASPTDFPPLDVEAEWSKLSEALRGLEKAGRVEVHRLPNGTLGQLQSQLRKTEYHVFHYIGHGAFAGDAGDGMLALEGPFGRGELVSGDDLGTLLHDHRTLRLALLNSCEGARAGRSDPYSGTAQSLIRNGIPAVVAMQFEITDEAAVMFSRSLYEAVADGYPLDAAVAEARKAVRHCSNPVEWGTPVLYMRSPDGRIFDIDRPLAATIAEAAAPAGGVPSVRSQPREDAPVRESPTPTPLVRPSSDGPRRRAGILAAGAVGLMTVCFFAVALVLLSRSSTQTVQPVGDTSTVVPSAGTSSAGPQNQGGTPSATTGGPAGPSSPAGPSKSSAPSQSEADDTITTYFDRFNGRTLSQSDMATLFMPTIQWYGKTVSRDALYGTLSQVDVDKQNQTFDPPVFRSFSASGLYGGLPSSTIDYRVAYHKPSGDGAVIVSYTLVKGVDSLCRIALVSEAPA